ncbi:MAG: hypothetical protein B6U87_01875 [Candidatus Aenigmarchaeota archaeon ex4484_52]|nr:MAG: hypothetical protein B6U87_01875 [Candidatus Aenigmarchaeota archaeon ex4484_52]
MIVKFKIIYFFAFVYFFNFLHILNFIFLFFSQLSFQLYHSSASAIKILLLKVIFLFLKASCKIFKYSKKITDQMDYIGRQRH